MRPWIREIYLAARGLAKSPTFFLVSVITLALGTGAMITIFTVADTVLLKPLPYEEPERLVRVFSTAPSSAGDPGSTSLPDYFDWKSQSETLESLAGFVRWSYNLTGEDGSVQRVWGGMVTAGLFETMRVKPLLGRSFLPEEEQPRGPHAVLLSHGLWRTLFAGSPDAIGQTLRLDEVDHAIVGVMPPDFEFPADARLWVPLGMGPDTLPRGVRFLRLVGRLAPGVPIEKAQAEMSALAGRLAIEHPETNTARGVRLVPLREHLVGDVRPALLVLLGAAALVMLIACANVANLLLARFNERRDEAALRRALGASRARLAGRAFLEALLLAAAGSFLGLALASMAVKGLVALNMAQENPSVAAERLHDVPWLAQVGIDGRVIAFAALAGLAAALIVSLFPVWQLSEESLMRQLNAGGKGRLGGGGGLRLRRMFVVAEVALALTLVIGAGLLIRSFSRLLQVDTGFRGDNVLTFQLSLPMMRYMRGSQTAGFCAELLERIEALPGVASAGLTWGLPLGGLTGTAAVEIDGRPAARGEDTHAALQPVSPRYFETLGIPLVRGRFFTAQDGPEGPPVLLVNESMARRFWPGQDPVGKRVTFDAAFGPIGMVPRVPREVVGVVADFKSAGLGRETGPEMYFPYPQATWRMVSVAVRSEGDPLLLADRLRQEVQAMDKDLSVFQLGTMEEVVSRSVARPRFNMALLVIFAAISLVLAAVGVYGIIAYSVSLRSGEIGVRMALGARRRDVLWQVLREAAALTAFGLLAGMLGALALTRSLSALLFGVAPTDPLTFALVALLFLLVAALASYLPARRATRVDPLVAMRQS